MPSIPLDQSYKPIAGSLYDPTNKQLVTQLGTPLTTAADGTPYSTTVASIVDGYKATYSASIAGVASAASATDIFIINGSASKTVRVLRLEITAQATTAAPIAVRLAIRSTANSGGTAATSTVIPYDSTNVAATAVVQTYTANPTLGTLVGTPQYFRNAWVYASAPATATAASGILVYDFGRFSEQAVVLRGVAQGLAVNLAGVTITGGSFDFNVIFTEE